MSIIEHDFGKEKRDIERRFRKLLGLDALHEDNIRANPTPYLERASERIFRLKNALFDAVRAAKAPENAKDPPDRIEVERAEYERLLQCLAIVEQALNDFGPCDDD